MTQQPATRKYSDDKYGEFGYWYYFVPETNSVFKTDYPYMKFSPASNVEELTYDEYLILSEKYNQNIDDLLL